MKVFISLMLLAIVVSLGFAMFFMLNDTGPKKRTVNALMIRVGLSVSLIVILIISYFMGWIQPHGIVP